MINDRKLKVGLIGCGGISGVHIPVWEKMEEAELVAVCDIRPEQMSFHAQKNCYTDFEEMLNNEELDILDICLPTYLHKEHAIKAMNRGIHVICEKPICLDKESIDEIYTTAKNNNVRFMVAHVLRFWPEYEKLKEVYDNGTYGKLLSGSVFRLGNAPYWTWDNWMQDEKRSGLVPFDLHIHDLDFVVYAFGTPNKMHAFRSKMPDQDYISAVYEYDGFYINGESSWYAGSYPFTSGFRFQFEKAVVAYENGTLIAYEKGDKKVELMSVGNEASGVINLPATFAYENEIRYFTDCVINGKSAEKVKQEELETVCDLLHNF